ncbi:MAG: EAL domain-containing protein [Betaproteobacteria bacterium]|nr:EAL domain-containing protein [Betaproteobacteria bacterium]
MNDSTTAKFDMERDLPRALAGNEFTLRYQPQLDIRSGRVVGVEALLRWIHPERGTVGPAEFIPAAEESGLIEAIGEWVLSAACAQARVWHASGLPEMTVAVNLSARQCLNPRLHDMVARVINDTGVDPQRLEFEITESVAMNSAEAAVANIRELKAMGVRLSIDDFGTGYSSLSQLKCCPVGKLKIDQSFVRNLGADATDAAIVRAIIFLGHSLEMTVLAEGVEPDRQLALLTAYECDEIQGYLLAPPVAAGEIPGLIRRLWNKRVATQEAGEKRNDLSAAVLL